MTEYAHKRAAASPTSGTFNAIAPGSRVNGLTVEVGQLGYAVVECLSALVTVLAETDTLVITPIWQVSLDGTTFVDCATTSQNAATVAIATGTAGADTTVTRVFGVSDAVYGYRYARMSLAVSGTTGAAQDTWSISYNYAVRT